jgi:hypothetical protein
MGIAYAIKHVPSGTVLTLPPGMHEKTEIIKGHVFDDASIGNTERWMKVTAVWEHEVNKTVARNIKAPMFWESYKKTPQLGLAASSSSDRPAAGPMLPAVTAVPAGFGGVCVNK